MFVHVSKQFSAMHGDAAKLLFLADGRKCLVCHSSYPKPSDAGAASWITIHFRTNQLTVLHIANLKKILRELCKFNGDAAKLLLLAVGRK